MRVPLHARRGAVGAAVLAAALVGAPTNTSAIEVSSDGSIVAEALLGPLPTDEGIVWSAPSGNGRTVFVRTKALLLPGLVFTDRFRVYAVDTVTRQVREVTADGDFAPFAVSTGARRGRARHGRRHPATFAMPEPVTNMRQMSISADGTTVAFTATTGLGDTLSPSRLFLGDIATGAVLEPFTGADGDLFDA